MKPRIGITTWTEQKPRAPYLTLSQNYLDSVVRGGGSPWPIPVGADAAAYLDALDGLVLSGGEDIWPRFYGEDPLPAVSYADPARDRWEVSLVREARRRQMPIFGICRGHQLINVALGGTLWQDLPTQRPGGLGHYPPDLPMDELWQELRLVPGRSRLRAIFGQDTLEVNSFHHQAVKDLAPGLRATAHTADGVIEAFEADTEDFLLGVQFHPEALTARYPAFVELFRAFVDACR